MPTSFPALTNQNGAQKQIQPTQTLLVGDGVDTEAAAPIQIGPVNATSVAEGPTTASGLNSHSEGLATAASGANSHAEGDATFATAPSAHAEGQDTHATGNRSHAEGAHTTAGPGFHTHAEGNTTTASGTDAHSEGNSTTASGNQAHAEGLSTNIGVTGIASNTASHSEGQDTVASGPQGHAEGLQTTASGNQSHAQGWQTNATLDQAHAEGAQTNATGRASHAEGQNTTAGGGDQAHAEGQNSMATGNQSHAQGYQTTSSGFGSHSEGVFSSASNSGDHAEGVNTTASSVGQAAHAEGLNTQALNDGAHSEGISTYTGVTGIATGQASHVEGQDSIASGFASHAEGLNTNCNANATHSEGWQTNANNNQAHAEGQFTNANGSPSHAEGNGTTANNNGDHSEGVGTTAGSVSQGGAHAEGVNTFALNDGAHAEGVSSFAGGTGVARGVASHSEGQDTQANFLGDHAEGVSTFAQSTSLGGAHAEGVSTFAFEDGAHSEGAYTRAIGLQSHAEGASSNPGTRGIATGTASHSEGQDTIASGAAAHAEGLLTTASGDQSHAEGANTFATNSQAHAEGANNTTASGIASHAEGSSSTASGEAAHAEGASTAAAGFASHAQGSGTVASGNSSSAVGLSSVASRDYEEMFASGGIFTEGDAQQGRSVYSGSTAINSAGVVVSSTTTAVLFVGLPDSPASSFVPNNSSKIVVEADAASGNSAGDFATFDFDLATRTVPLNSTLYGSDIDVIIGGYVPGVFAPTFATAGASEWRMQVASLPQYPSVIGGETREASLQFYFYSSIETYALNFYGTEYVTVTTDPTLTPSSSFTFEMWMQVQDTPIDALDTIQQAVWGTGDPGVSQEWAFMLNPQYLSPAQGIFLAFNCVFTTFGAVNFTLQGSPSAPGVGVNDGLWHHYAATYDSVGGALTLWIDGDSISTIPVGPGDSLVPNVNPLILGNTGTLVAPYFTGTLGNVRISNVDRYTGTFFPPPSYTVDANTVAYWPFLDSGGGITADTSGNVHDGTLAGLPGSAVPLPVFRPNNDGADGLAHKVNVSAAIRYTEVVVVPELNIEGVANLNGDTAINDAGHAQPSTTTALVFVSTLPSFDGTIGYVAQLAVSATATDTSGPDSATFNFLGNDVRIAPINPVYPASSLAAFISSGGLPGVFAPTTSTPGASAWRMQAFSVPMWPNTNPDPGTLPAQSLPAIQFYFYSSISTYALNFYGTEYVTVPADPTLTPTGSFTFEMWMQAPQATLPFDGGSAYKIPSVWGTGDPSGGSNKVTNAWAFRLFAPTGGPGTVPLAFAGNFVNKGQVGLHLLQNSIVTDGLWHHYAVTYDGVGGELTMWVDGSSLSGATFNVGPGDSLVPTTNPLILGNTGTRTGNFQNVYFAGTLGNVRVSNTNLYTAAFTPSPSYVPGTDTLAYFGETLLFVVGDVITGSTSGATGTVTQVNDNGSGAGTLLLTGAGAFQGGEAILPASISGATATVGSLNYSGESPTVFAVGDTVTGGTSGATGAVVNVADNGAGAGTLTFSTTTLVFLVGEPLSAAPSGATATSGGAVFNSTVAYWPFLDSGAGMTNDVSGNGHNGTLAGLSVSGVPLPLPVFRPNNDGADGPATEVSIVGTLDFSGYE